MAEAANTVPETRSPLPTRDSVRAALAIGRTINPGPGREQTARYFALIDAPLGQMEMTAGILGAVLREDRRVAADVDLTHAVARLGEAA